MRQDLPFEITYWYEISRHGRMVSWFSGGTVKPGAPGHEQNRHLFGASCYVGPADRRQGIGRTWLPLILELMDRHGCSILTVSSEEESGHAFLKWLGAEPRLNDLESRLRIADVDWEMVDRWIADGPVRSPQTRLEIYDGYLPEAMWDEYAPQLTALVKTMPMEGLDHGEEVITPAQMGNWYERLKLAQEVIYTVLAREPDGTMAGMTDLSMAPYRRTVAQQMFSGVRPDLRGRGIGKWLKAVMLERIHRLYPETEWITTRNVASNAPMLAINTKLGFRPYRRSVEYQMSRDQLEDRTGSLGAG